MGRGYSGRNILLSGRPRIGSAVMKKSDSVENQNLSAFAEAPGEKEIYCDTCGFSRSTYTVGEDCGHKSILGVACKGRIVSAEIRSIRECMDIYKESKGEIKIEIPAGTRLAENDPGIRGFLTRRKITVRRPEFVELNGSSAIMWHPGNGTKAVFFRDIPMFQINE